MRNFIEAGKSAAEKIEGWEPTNSVVPNFEEDLVPSEFEDLIFGLQQKIEVSDGGMDYGRFAEEFWDIYMDGLPAEGQVFNDFEVNIVVGLHRIDMRGLVFDSIRKSMPKLIEKNQDKVEKLVLWSRGDVNATGYQDAKIRNSGVNMDFVHELCSVNGDDVQKSQGFLRDKTMYMVEPDKMVALREYFEERKEGGEDKINLVVVEDSPEYFDKVLKLAVEIYGEMNVELTQVWAAYSRRGEKARLSGQYPMMKSLFGGIDDFSELCDVDMNDAVVLVDFDGVICDNVKMRRAQAQVIYGAFLQAQRELEA